MFPSHPHPRHTTAERRLIGQNAEVPGEVQRAARSPEVRQESVEKRVQEAVQGTERGQGRLMQMWMRLMEFFGGRRDMPRQADQVTARVSDAASSSPVSGSRGLRLNLMDPMVRPSPVVRPREVTPPAPRPDVPSVPATPNIPPQTPNVVPTTPAAPRPSPEAVRESLDVLRGILQAIHRIFSGIAISIANDPQNAVRQRDFTIVASEAYDLYFEKLLRAQRNGDADFGRELTKTNVLFDKLQQLLTDPAVASQRGLGERIQAGRSALNAPTLRFFTDLQRRTAQENSAHIDRELQPAMQRAEERWRKESAVRLEAIAKIPPVMAGQQVAFLVPEGATVRIAGADGTMIEAETRPLWKDCAIGRYQWNQYTGQFILQTYANARTGTALTIRMPSSSGSAPSETSILLAAPATTQRLGVVKAEIPQNNDPCPVGRERIISLGSGAPILMDGGNEVDLRVFGTYTITHGRRRCQLRYVQETNSLAVLIPDHVPFGQTVDLVLKGQGSSENVTLKLNIPSSTAQEAGPNPERLRELAGLREQLVKILPARYAPANRQFDAAEPNHAHQSLADRASACIHHIDLSVRHAQTVNARHFDGESERYAKEARAIIAEHARIAG